MRTIVKGSTSVRENVFVCSGIRQSFVLGLLRPRIYIPESLGGEQIEHVLDHEKQHIRHFDHIFKLAFYLMLIVYWFSPLCHIAYKLFSEDIEIACDERTIRRKNPPYRMKYMQAFLNCTSYEKKYKLGMLSFGDVGIKGG